MRLGIMQPYFMPYIGYFQLIHAVDQFVIYDNIEYTKKGWINRNRILVNNKDKFISIPLKNDSDFLNISQRFLATNWQSEKERILRQITESYRKAPFFKDAFILIESILNSSETNLFEFILQSIKLTNTYLEITTPIIVSSTINIDHSLKAEQKVIAICQAMKADVYINSIGGQNLYNKDEFKTEGIQLKFLQQEEISYSQFNNQFIPFLSMIDLIMFNSKLALKEMLNKYQLI